MAQPIARDFISDERRQYKIKFGSVLASALSGFIAGVIITSIIWMAAAYYTRLLAH